MYVDVKRNGNGDVYTNDGYPVVTIDRGLDEIRYGSVKASCHPLFWASLEALNSFLHKHGYAVKIQKRRTTTIPKPFYFVKLQIDEHRHWEISYSDKDEVAFHKYTNGTLGVLCHGQKDYEFETKYIPMNRFGHLSGNSLLSPKWNLQFLVRRNRKSDYPTETVISSHKGEWLYSLRIEMT